MCIINSLKVQNCCKSQKLLFSVKSVCIVTQKHEIKHANCFEKFCDLNLFIIFVVNIPIKSVEKRKSIL